MNILVLGGNSYLGSKTIQKLMSENSITATVRNKNNINMPTEVHIVDTSMEAIDRELNSVQVDVIINYICNYGRQIKDYNDVLTSNVLFPSLVLNSAIKNGVKRFITFDTGLPYDLDIYSYTKKELSDYGRFLTKKHQISFTDIKLEMYYGPDEPANRFFPSIIRKMINGEEVKTTIGTQRRDIIWYEDVIRAVIMILNADLPGYEEISVGTGIAPTISEIVDFLWDVTDRKSNVKKGAVQLRDNEPNCVANIDRISSLGKWEPLFWKDGLTKMVKSLFI